MEMENGTVTDGNIFKIEIWDSLCCENNCPVDTDIQNSAEIPEHEVSKSPHSVQSPFVESGNTTGNSVKTENTGLHLNPGSSRKMCPTEKKSISNETIQIPIMPEQNLQSMSLQSIPSYVCRICHNCENPDKYVTIYYREEV